jgi:hypothetical protein
MAEILPKRRKAVHDQSIKFTFSLEKTQRLKIFVLRPFEKFLLIIRRHCIMNQLMLHIYDPSTCQRLSRHGASIFKVIVEWLSLLVLTCLDWGSNSGRSGSRREVYH